MPNSTQEEKYRWIKPIIEKKLKIKDVALVCPFSERALKYWLSAYRKHGMAGLHNHSTRPRSQPNETPIRIKERVLELRKLKNDECALKLKWDLLEEGISLHERTIGKILKTEGVTRKYRTRKQYPKKPKAELKPGELIEIDVKYVPNKINGMQYYQFTAIDCASRWRLIRVYDQQTNITAIQFLHDLLWAFPYQYQIKAIKTDNGSIFTNRYIGYIKSTDRTQAKLHPFDQECEKHVIAHYLIDPGKPAQNGTVERSHRSDQEGFYEKINCKTIDELQYQVKLWNMYYNDLKHCGLNGKTPNQAIGLRVQNVCT